MNHFFDRYGQEGDCVFHKKRRKRQIAFSACGCNFHILQIGKIYFQAVGVVVVFGFQ